MKVPCLDHVYSGAVVSNSGPPLEIKAPPAAIPDTKPVARVQRRGECSWLEARIVRSGTYATYLSVAASDALPEGGSMQYTYIGIFYTIYFPAAGPSTATGRL
jgi:hypothetical protein